MKTATANGQQQTTTTQATETKCNSCIHQEDFSYDCKAHNQEGSIRKNLWGDETWIVLWCEGHQTAEQQVKVAA